MITALKAHMTAQSISAGTSVSPVAGGASRGGDVTLNIDKASPSPASGGRSTAGVRLESPSSNVLGVQEFTPTELAVTPDPSRAIDPSLITAAQVGAVTVQNVTRSNQETFAQQINGEEEEEDLLKKQAKKSKEDEEDGDESVTEKAEKEKSKSADNPQGLTEAEQEQVDDLKARDDEVRAHEQAHARVGGQYAGSPNYEYERGPDNKQYAVGGHVKIDVSPESTPEKTIQKMEVVKRAALAPAEPSGQDRNVASQADQIKQEAIQQKQEERTAEAQARVEEQKSKDSEEGTAGEAGQAAVVPNQGAQSAGGVQRLDGEFSASRSSIPTRQQGVSAFGVTATGEGLLNASDRRSSRYGAQPSLATMRFGAAAYEATAQDFAAFSAPNRQASSLGAGLSV